MTATITSANVLHHSLLCLKAEHKQSRDALRDVQNFHRLIIDGFTGWVSSEQARSALNILFAFRADTDGILRVVVQSPFQPSWDDIDSSALLETPATWTLNTSNHQEGSSVHFELRAAPTRAVRRPAPHRGTRRAIHHRDEQLAWLERRLSAAGLTITYADVSHRIDLRSETKDLPSKRRGKQTDRFLLNTYRFTGVATITHRESYQQALLNGIGPGKAYGCGLLLTRLTNST